MSNITLNIVEPSSPTPVPVDPGTNPAVPNTGLFTHGIGAPRGHYHTRRSINTGYSKYNINGLYV